jgi:hypothetical protein
MRKRVGGCGAPPERFPDQTSTEALFGVPSRARRLARDLDVDGHGSVPELAGSYKKGI